ncbi:Glutathione S-transferase class-mu isozyme 1 [Araneus ventricosus]|uniref:glutathione transferase n=1 Tax=Araneus ventricosus TaxID=182803 RepID=A0A4Y2B9A4_ARAVE|nr:Glutathione S-transferase class-mu isozyme 1 [Araneus ventricosus]GBL88805.1 Glutathione S-transferase class-mu isozyme 1 [Araneus ventricosus]
MTRPVLGYWEVRGLAEPIRYLLHYKKVDFEDKRYPRNVLGFEDWQKDKFSLGLDFPNLPYYIDGDTKITQSVAILRFLAYRHGLIAKTKEQHRRTIVAEQQCIEFRRCLFLKSFDESGKEGFLTSVQPKFQQWEKFLGDRKFIAGNDITYVDFMVYEALEFYRLYHETILDDYPILEAYFSRIKNLPELQEYMNSPVRQEVANFRPRR